MNTTLVSTAVGGGQIRPASLHATLIGIQVDISGYCYNGGTEIWCDPAKEAAIRAAIAAHYATDWTAQETADAQRAADLDTSINTSAIVQQLKPMTNAQFNAWWAANVTNLAQAGLILREVVKYIVRRLP